MSLRDELSAKNVHNPAKYMTRCWQCDKPTSSHEGRTAFGIMSKPIFFCLTCVDEMIRKHEASK